jgi:NADH:ubiquinone oxidoreductase subunit 4 (subunit M)
LPTSQAKAALPSWKPSAPASAIFYYLQIVRKGVFGEKSDGATPKPITLDWSATLLCILLLVGIVWLGVAPAPILDTISASVAGLNLPL